MAKLIVRALREGDLDFVAARLRPADVDEAHASVGHHDMALVLRESVERSTMVWAIEVGGEPAGLFGAAEAAPDIGVPWLLGTAALERAPKQLTKLGRQYVRLMLQRYATLVNLVDARNLKSIYWLARLGFTVHANTVPFGPFNMPFHRFGATQ
ncbi:hypothetical protein ABLT15_28145 [Paraburkholderia tropica]|uniref:hypothetical protein n=1 Tax=Paraburkholderia tropica TaxID=92647 RepID=UPI0032B5F213